MLNAYRAPWGLLNPKKRPFQANAWKRHFSAFPMGTELITVANSVKINPFLSFVLVIHRQRA